MGKEEDAKKQEEAKQNKLLFLTTLSPDLTQHILTVGGTELLELVVTAGGETISSVVDPNDYRTFLAKSGYVYEENSNALIKGGISPLVVAYTLERSGIAGLPQLLRKMGRQIARTVSLDVLKPYCERRGIPYETLAVQLTERAPVLLAAKDTDASKLEELVRGLQAKKGSVDSTLFDQLVVASEDLERQLEILQRKHTKLEEDYRTINTQYVATLLEITGKINLPTLEKVVRETIELLKPPTGLQRAEIVQLSKAVSVERKRADSLAALATLYETQLKERGMPEKDMIRLRKQQTGLDALERGLVAELKRYVTEHPLQPVGYVFLLDSLMRRDGKPSEGDRKYISYLYFRARKTGGVPLLTALGSGYISGKEYAPATRFAEVLVIDRSCEAFGYRMQAQIIRAQNTSGNPGVEKRAALFDYRAKQIEKEIKK